MNLKGWPFEPMGSPFSYDSRGRPLTIDVKDGETSFLDLDYTYDSNSNITQLVNGWRDTSSNWNLDTESYSYDGLDRLMSANCMSWSHTYSYDRAGNRTAEDSVNYTINEVNEVTSLSDGTSFTYDSNGNRIQKSKGTDTWVYTYDYNNRLTKVEKNSEVLGEYTYAGDGKRIQVTENGITTTYIYSGLNVLYEENTAGSATYIYGPTGRFAKRATINGESNTFYYHTDHLGSTRLVTDENKDYFFTGKEMDGTGLYYFGARYYDQEIGRFITRDFLRGQKTFPQTLNRYTYCLNNPVKFIDPDGLKSKYYFGDNPNPVKVTPETWIIAGFLILAGAVLIIAVLASGGALIVAIPGWVQALVYASPVIAGVVLDEDGTSWMEDVDGDGEWELVVVIRKPYGEVEHIVIEEDGTIYLTLYDKDGSIIDKWKMIPDPTNPDEYIIYVWDEKAEQWLLDQNKNGIPDKVEEPDNSDG